MACHHLGAHTYRYESGHGCVDAQRNLAGRSHYVDPDTLRAFQARVLVASPVENVGGLLYALVESVNSRPDHGGKNKRAVVFDIFGTVLTDREIWHRTRQGACKSLNAFLASFDLLTYYRREIKRRAARMTENARRARRALAGK